MLYAFFVTMGPVSECGGRICLGALLFPGLLPRSSIHLSRRFYPLKEAAWLLRGSPNFPLGADALASEDFNHHLRESF
jgi:hypothetical protein